MWKAGVHLFLFSSFFSIRCYSSFNLCIDPLIEYTRIISIPTTSKWNRYRKCIVADRQSWIVQDYASASPKDIISRYIMPSGSKQFCTDQSCWFIPWCLDPEVLNVHKRRKKVIFRFFLRKNGVKVDEETPLSSKILRPLLPFGT